VKASTRRKAIATAVAISTASLSLLPAVSASAAPKAPGKLTVKRTGENLQQLAIQWSPVPGVSNYTVTVFDGKKDISRVVDGKTTELVVDAPGECTRYQVRVASVDDSGTASTGIYRVPTLAPGGVGSMQTDRSNDGEGAKAYWKAPQFPGSGGEPAYLVQLKAMASGKIVEEFKTKETEVKFGDLDPKRQYAVKVTPYNEYGQCITGTSLIRNEKPSPSTDVQVYRDGTSPAIVHLTWNPPKWNGYGKIEGFEIYYRQSDKKKPEVDKVKAGDNHWKATLNPDKAYTFQIRAFGSSGFGEMSKPVTLAKDGAEGTEENDPKIEITEADQVVAVNFAGPVGSSKKYPQMRLDIQPTVGKGYRAAELVSNGAGSISLGKVPCGVYTVVVTGLGEKGSKEFGRTAINLCNTGLIPQNLWRKVFGQADIKGNTVDMHYGNESRVLSTVKRTSKNAVFTTEATLRNGWGYGIWTRADVSKNGNKISGYSFQYDPGYANVNAGFGKALLLRLWEEGKECGTPLARVKWPAGLEVNDTHKIVVVNEGDVLYASIDGIKMFDVPSLKEAIEKSKCEMQAPEGTEVGFRSWNAKTSVVFENTTLS
jgi:hypothetical protein